ncbi:GNAT family N-acetyltransferase [Sphingomonas adhaesiva]|uniref:GNAT family N-acetyltransferase n=1 Tax=Sphingomonas adhaesiva TaxID=28212 RepID=UPI002FF50361
MAACARDWRSGGALRFERLAPEVAAGAWIDTLLALETSGWKGREGVAAAADPATERCFRAILTDAHARGALDFHRMTVGDATIAMLANLESGDESFQLKIAYDEEWAAFSPGVLIEMAYLEHALDVRGLARVDSCARAGHPMIDRLWPARRTIVSLAVPFDNVRSRLMCRGMEAWRRRRANRREQA